MFQKGHEHEMASSGRCSVPVRREDRVSMKGKVRLDQRIYCCFSNKSMNMPLRCGNRVSTGKPQNLASKARFLFREPRLLGASWLLKLFEWDGLVQKNPLLWKSGFENLKEDGNDDIISVDGITIGTLNKKRKYSAVTISVRTES